MTCPSCGTLISSLRNGCPCGHAADLSSQPDRFGTGRNYPKKQNPAQQYAAAMNIPYTAAFPQDQPGFEIYLEDQSGGLSELCQITYIKECFDPMANKTVYVIRVESPFVLTEKDVKQRMGIGFKVLSVDGKEQVPEVPRELDTDHMTEAIIREGYRALAKICHPDRNGNPEAMIALNKTKKELVELLTKLGGNLNI